MNKRDLELKQIRIENNIKSLNDGIMQLSTSNNFAIRSLMEKRAEEQYELKIVKEQLKRCS